MGQLQFTHPPSKVSSVMKQVSTGHILIHVPEAVNSSVPTIPVRTAFAPMSHGQPLTPTRSIVTNSPTVLSPPAFRSVAPTNYNTFGKLNLRYTQKSAGLSTKPIELAARPSTSTSSMAVPVVTLTPPPSSSDAPHLHSLQSSGGPPTLVGGKKRLGMGQGGTGYSNKKFKTPRS